MQHAQLVCVSLTPCCGLNNKVLVYLGKPALVQRRLSLEASLLGELHCQQNTVTSSKLEASCTFVLKQWQRSSPEQIKPNIQCAPTPNRAKMGSNQRPIDNVPFNGLRNARVPEADETCAAFSAPRQERGRLTKSFRDSPHHVHGQQYAPFLYLKSRSQSCVAV